MDRFDPIYVPYRASLDVDVEEDRVWIAWGGTGCTAHTALSPAEAREFAAALVRAARFIEDNQP